MDNKKSFLGGIIVLLLLVGFFFARPAIIGFFNTENNKVQQAHNKTSYKVKKKVEDTARSMVASYKADKLAYEQYKDSTDEEKRDWSDSYKIRANKTAISYNEYILKNKNVWDGNIPTDIDVELEVIQ